MTKKELDLLSDDELKEIAMMKCRKGTATNDAKKAQEILWERSGRPFDTDFDSWYGRNIAPETGDQGYWEGVV